MVGLLQDRCGLIVGIANDRSIAWGCADVMHREGAALAVTYMNDKARPHVEPLAQRVQAGIFQPLDVTRPDQMEALFDAIERQWGRLDFLVHSIAYAPKQDLHGRVVDTSSEGFALAIDISCHSFLRLARRAEPLMSRGGSLITMSYYGAEKVVSNYNVMGPVKAALETAVAYMAVELGPSAIRVNAISPGPIATRAASGLPDFEGLLTAAEGKAPLRTLVDVHDVGEMAAFLASSRARAITGSVHYVDCGYEIVD
ncbi:MAG: enoyl-ACP reductase FabI [Rhodothalassiaceae bacterium]